MATGEWDLIVAEDLSRIFRNPRFQWAFVQDAVDAGIRVICFADNLDTADENWETSVAVATLRHGLTIPDTRRRIKRSATESFYRGGQVGKVRAGHGRVSKEDAVAGTFGPKGLRIRRVDSFTAVLQEIRCRFAAGHSPGSVVEWMNAERIPTGPYVTSGRWTKKLLKDTLQDPILHGTRTFRRILNRQIFSTGKYRRDHNVSPEIQYVAELAHMTREQQEQLLALVNWRINWGGAKPPSTPNPRKGVSRYQSLWPAQSATCEVCGGVMYVVGNVLKCRNSPAAVEQTCWNHVQAPIADLRAFATTWLLEQFNSSVEFRNTLSPVVREQLAHLGTRRNLDRERREAEIAALRTRERNLRKSIGIAEQLTGAQLESLVGDLSAVTVELKKKLEEKQLATLPPEPAGEVGEDEIAKQLPELLNYLLETSFEMAEVMRGLVPRCVIVPVQAFDSGQVHPRAKLYFRAVHSVSSAGETDTFEELCFDLFEPPVHLAHLREAVRLRSLSPRPTLKQIGSLLGTSYMTIKRALAAASKMESLRLTEPFVELTAKPTYASRWKDAS